MARWTLRAASNLADAQSQSSIASWDDDDDGSERRTIVVVVVVVGADLHLHCVAGLP